MAQLYKIADDFNQCLTEWVEAELDTEEGANVDEAFATTMEMIEQQLTEKGQGVGAFILNRKIFTDAKEALAKKLMAEVKAERGKEEWLKQYLKTNMQKCGITEIKANDGTFTIKLGAIDKSLVVDNMDLIDAKYVTTKVVETKSVDKTELKKLISAGEHIEGVHIEENQRLSIK